MPLTQNLYMYMAHSEWRNYAEFSGHMGWISIQNTGNLAELSYINRFFKRIRWDFLLISGGILYISSSFYQKQ